MLGASKHPVSFLLAGSAMFELIPPREGEPWADEVYKMKARLRGEDPDEALQSMIEGAEFVSVAISAEELVLRERYLPTLVVDGDTITVTTTCEQEGWTVYIISEVGDEVVWGATINATLIHVIAFAPKESIIYTEQFMSRLLEQNDCIIWTFRRG